MAVLQRLSRERGDRGRAARLAEMAAFAGDAEIPYRMARDHLPPTLRSRRWAFPEATAAGLGAAARALGVDPSLARAVARRESAFVASARSAAAAEGLLQLRPQTAARLGEVLGLPPLPDGALLDPGENVPLGVAYLGLLLSRFGAVPVALAAYNAGPVPASAWARDLAGRPLDEWLEDLPYRETRQYVRGVVADWARYRRLRGDPPPAVDPAQPIRPPGDGVAF
jgi:soluble lytic murein transglycosylase